MRLDLLTTLFVLLLSAPAHAQQWNLFMPCEEVGFDQRELNFRRSAGHCDPDTLVEKLALFGARPIADLAGSGGQMIRVIVANGYGSEVLTIELVRRAGEATTRVFARDRGDGDRRAPGVIEAELDVDAWLSAASRAAAFAETPAVLPAFEYTADGEEVITLCIHPWSVTVETFGFGAPRVMARDACDRPDDVYEFASRVERQAFASFEGCEWIDPRFFRNVAARLSFCIGLSGEVHVAAGASNAVQPFLEDNLASERFRYLLADDFALTLNGEAIAGADAAHMLWRRFIGEGDYGMFFDVASGAEDSEWRQRATITLLLFDEARTTDLETRYAEVQQTWRLVDELWLLQAMEVGSWQTFTFTDDD